MLTTPTFSSTLLIRDDDWNNNAGTHCVRPAIYLRKNRDGSVKVMRVTTQQASQSDQPHSTNRRVLPDGEGYGNSLIKPCDLVGGDHGIIDIPSWSVVCKLGELSKADAWWVEDQIA